MVPVISDLKYFHHMQTKLFDAPVDLGGEVWADGRKVGVVTCLGYSKLTKKSMGIAHTITFDDPEKKKRTVVG